VNTVKRSFGALALLLAMLVPHLASCAGPNSPSGLTAKELLIPAMRDSWKNVQLDVERGRNIMTAAQDPNLDEAALDAGLAQVELLLEKGPSLGRTVPEWPAVEHVAGIGIASRVDSGEVGAGVAGSLLERLRNFAAGLRQLELAGGNP
jgi:hypothetical protein